MGPPAIKLLGDFAVDQPSPLVLPWFIKQNNYNENITLQNKNKPFKNTKHLFLSIFYFFLLWSMTESKVGSYTGGHDTSRPQKIDKRTIMKNKNRGAVLGRQQY